MTEPNSQIYEPKTEAVLFQFSKYPQFLTGISIVVIHLFFIIIQVQLFVNCVAKLQKYVDFMIILDYYFMYKWW